MMNITSMILTPAPSKIVTLQWNWSLLGTNDKKGFERVRVTCSHRWFTNCTTCFVLFKTAKAALIFRRRSLSAAIKLIILSSSCSSVLHVTRNNQSSIKLSGQDENLVSIFTSRQRCGGYLRFGHSSRGTQRWNVHRGEGGEGGCIHELSLNCLPSAKHAE